MLLLHTKTGWRDILNFVCNMTKVMRHLDWRHFCHLYIVCTCPRDMYLLMQYWFKPSVRWWFCCCLFIVCCCFRCLWEFCVWSLFRCADFCDILLGKRELVDWHFLFSICYAAVVFLASSSWCNGLVWVWHFLVSLTCFLNHEKDVHIFLVRLYIFLKLVTCNQSE